MRWPSTWMILVVTVQQAVLNIIEALVSRGQLNKTYGGTQPQVANSKPMRWRRLTSVLYMSDRCRRRFRG